tara:strand:+ start:2698 stop:3045 length:348 start_codon:yes stop_codon:yes gene_type:complete
MNNMKIFLTIIIIVVLFSYGWLLNHLHAEDKYPNEPALRYSTVDIRQLWEVCSYQFQILYPSMQRSQRTELCDCYVDHMRTKHTPEEVKALTPTKSKELGFEMAVVCPIINREGI